MARYLRLSFLSLTILTLGLSLQYWRRSQVVRKSSEVKAIEVYWTETGIAIDKASDLINDRSCVSSERYFLSCINGLLNAAEKHNLDLQTNGQLIALHDLGLASEKALLEKWKNWFRSHRAEAASFPYAKILQNLVNKKSELKELTTGLAINGFISVFRDPHTYIMPLSYYNEVVSQTDSKSSALGIVLAKDERNYFVRKVLEKSPAESAGLRKGDIILKVNERKVEHLTLAQVSDLLKGKVGDEIVVSVQRQEQKVELELVRTISRIPTVTHRMVEGLRPVGLITINKFATGTCQKVQSSLEDLLEQRIKGLLLDLRDNPGGQMEEAACVAGLFLGKDKKIFELRYLDPAKEVESYNSPVDQVYDGPVAVLVNSGSASAAEIVAGALRDWGRAVMVGERTFGKGSFQEGEVWSENESLALFQTKGFYYLPSGKSPQLFGIEPDVKVSFRKSVVSRELDQYWSPLTAPPRKPWVGDMIANHSSDCLGMEELTSNDLEIDTAKESLFCSASVAGGQL